MNNEQVIISAEERADFEAFRIEKAKKEAATKKKEDRDTYKLLVDETISYSMPVLQEVSNSLTMTKQSILDAFDKVVEIKADLFGSKDGQRSNTFTHSCGNMRIIIGYHTLDAYRDTVNEGITMVKEYIESLAKDDDSRALVRAVLKLLSRDQEGNLKASRVLQLRRMADDSGNEKFIEGVRIIEESYQPTISKRFIRAESKGKNNEWVSIALGMTEA